MTAVSATMAAMSAATAVSTAATTGLAVLAEAVATVYGPALRGLEWHLAGRAAFAAGRIKQAATKLVLVVTHFLISPTLE